MFSVVYILGHVEFLETPFLSELIDFFISHVLERLRTVDCTGPHDVPKSLPQV